MIFRLFSILCFVLFLSTSAAFAHEGHAHKVMGTLSAVQERALEVKSTSGETVHVVLTDKTRISRSGTAMQPSDLKPGDRVVVTYEETKGTDGKPILTATEVRVGSSK